MTKKNILSVARVLANKTEGWVPEESVNFMLSNFDLVPVVEVNHFLGTQGVSLRKRDCALKKLMSNGVGIVLRVKLPLA